MSEDLLIRTVINATARIQPQEDGTFKHELVIGFLPIDDIIRWESNKFSSVRQCVEDMLIGFHKNIKTLIGEYEP